MKKMKKEPFQIVHKPWSSCALVFLKDFLNKKKSGDEKITLISFSLRNCHAKHEDEVFKKSNFKHNYFK